MNTEITIFLTLSFLLIIFTIVKRSNIRIEPMLSIPIGKRKIPIIYAVMYPTKFGLKFIDYLVSIFPRLFKRLGLFLIVLGFIGMIVIVYVFGSETLRIFSKPETITMSTVQLVLPFKTATHLYVPLTFWLLSIFIIAVVHEGGHALIARAHRLRVKSTGFATLNIILPIIPMAYVDIDEKQMSARRAREQLSVLSAGPIFNVVFSVLVALLLVFVTTPILNKNITYAGLEIVQSSQALLKEGEIIHFIEGIPIKNTRDLYFEVGLYNPGEIVEVTTNSGIYDVALLYGPAGTTVLGITVSQIIDFKESSLERYGRLPLVSFKWFHNLMRWVFILSLGIGLFNLIPIGPIDGGRIVKVLSEKSSKTYGTRIWKAVSYVFFVILLILIFAPRIARIIGGL